MKFGELLLHEQIITAAQLGDALRWQVLYGVRLGRALIEMGYVSESMVGEMLSRKLGVPAVGRKELLSLGSQTVTLLSPEIAVKLRAIPLGVAGRLLRVAMTDPTDRQSVDIIAQETGAIVQALVSPDLLICIALEKYYGSRCRRHELPLPGNSQPALDRYATGGSGGGEAAPSCEVISDGAGVDYEGHDEDSQVEDPFSPPPELISKDGVIELDPLAVSLAGARSREDVADAVIEQLSARFQAVALVMIRNNNAVGWRAASCGHSISCCDGATLPLGASPALRSLLKGKPFHGAFLPTPDHARMIDTMRLGSEAWLLSLPITMQKKTVAALLVWGDSAGIASAEEELKRISFKIALALQMLILRSKILAN